MNVVSDEYSPKKYHVYGVEEDMECYILVMNDEYENPFLIEISAHDISSFPNHGKCTLMEHPPRKKEGME